MAKYLFEVNYIGEGLKGLLKDGGTKRRAVVENLLKQMGGTMESFYYAFGDTDLFLICDIPDHVSASAIALTVVSTGTVTLKTSVLLTPEQIDEAAKKTPNYTPPGK